MAAFRDFDAALAEQGKEKPTFVLAGETFTCRAKLPWAALTKLTRDTGDDGSYLVKVDEFFATVLVRADRERFAALVADEDPDDDDAIVSVDQVQEVMAWLMGHYTGKAQEPSGSSSDGPEPTGQPSRVINLGRRAG